MHDVVRSLRLSRLCDSITYVRVMHSLSSMCALCIIFYVLYYMWPSGV